MNAKTNNLIRFVYLRLMVILVVCEVLGFVFLGLNKNLSLLHYGNYFFWADFVQFYMAGRVTISAQRSLLYSWDVQEHLLQSITSLHLTREDSATQYSPLVFLMMAPYSLLPIDCAQLLFDATSVLVGVGGYFALSRCLLGQ